MQTLAANGVNTRRAQLIGTGLWDDPRIFAEPGAQGGWFAAPDPSGFRAFSGRYRSRYGQDPVRPATLAYDAVSLVAALVKTQGAARFSEEVLTNASGFAGIDGVFRFRPDGTNQRGLAVMRVTTSGRAGDQPGAEGVRERDLSCYSAASGTVELASARFSLGRRHSRADVIEAGSPAFRTLLGESSSGCDRSSRQR